MQGPMFMDGMQETGDASTKVFHRTASDGTEHHIDVKLMPHAFNHVALVPTVWDCDGQVFTITSNTALSGDVQSYLTSNVDRTPDETLEVAAGETLTCFSTDAILALGIGLSQLTHHGFETIARMQVVYTRDITEPSRMLNWSDFQVRNIMSPHDDGDLNYGHDLHGLLPVMANGTQAAVPEVDPATGNVSLPIIDPGQYLLRTTTALYSWFNHNDYIRKALMAAKDVTPYKSEFSGLTFESVNIVSMLSFNTGEPALQQMGDAIFTLGFCGVDAGWSFDNRARLDRQIWNPEVHNYAGRRFNGWGDYIGLLVPIGLDASKILTTYASANLLAWKLGLLGLRHTEDDSNHVEIGFQGVRTIYRSIVFLDGSVKELSITGNSEGFNFFTELPVALDTPANNFAATDAAGATVEVNQLAAQPGARFNQRLFTFLDGTAAPGIGNSTCSLFGMRQNPHLDGSNVDGLTGYADDVPQDTLDILTGDGDYEVPNAPGGGTPIDPELIRLMVQYNRGVDNLHYNESGLRIAMMDQDVFDMNSAIDSAMEHEHGRQMITGPCAHLVVFDKDGNVVYDIKDVYELVGSGQSASASTQSSAPSTPDADPSPPQSETPSKEAKKDEEGSTAL